MTETSHRRRRILGALGAGLAVLLGTSGWAAATARGPGGWHERWHTEHAREHLRAMLERSLDEVGASEAQRAQILEIAELTGAGNQAAAESLTGRGTVPSSARMPSALHAPRAEALRAGRALRLDVRVPLPRETVRSLLPLIGVAGRFSRQLRPLDLVIALDVSKSVFLPAEVDLDGDGAVGQMSKRGTGRRGSPRPPRAWTTDPGDTVFEAARAGARQVLEALSGSGVRVGLLSFAEDTRVRARLGSPERALEALESIPVPPEPGTTDLELAIRVGQSLLSAHHDDGREKILLILSDGHATRPRPPLLADRAARRAARTAARSGISIYPVAIGPYAADGSSVYAELATLTQGAYFDSRDLARIRSDVPRVESTSALVQVEINNLTTGDRGRAVRVQSDGAFDGFVRLAPGTNRLSIQALAFDGTRREAFRIVYFEPAREPTGADLALARSLRRRGLETELARKPELRRQLEIQVEP